MILNKKNNKLAGEEGQVMMIVVLILSGVIIGATAVSGLLTARQTHQTADSGSSAVSIHAADAGLEWRVYKLYEDWRDENSSLTEGNCADCGDSNIACDKKPEFIDNSVKINNADVKVEVVCSPIMPSPADPAYMYFNISSTAKVQTTSYVFEQTVKLAK